MPRYLSPEWFAAVADALGEGDTEDGITVQQRVTDGPEGEVVWHVRIDGSRVHFQFGPADDPDVTLSQGYATAAAVAQGDRSAQAAFMAGEIVVDGNVASLLAAAPALADVDDALTDVRAQTTY